MERHLSHILLISALVLIGLSSVESAANSTCITECHKTVPGAPYAPSCCNCCPGGTCNGNAIFATCCTPDQTYCGCISSRAYCDGRIYGGAAIESPFGTCFTKGSGCFYNPNPNTWIVCPAGTTGCIGSAYGSDCCTESQTCDTQTGSCVAKTSPPTSAGPATCNGAAYDTAAYTCTINDQGQSVLCPSGTSSCGQACYSSSHYCCQSGQLRQAGQCSAQTSAQTTAQPTTQPPATTGSNPATCNGAGYDHSTYTCTINEQGQQVLCPLRNSACGRACYSPSQFCCQSGQLRQAGQCSNGQTSANPTTNSQTMPPATTISDPDTCNGAAYDHRAYTCATNDQGALVLCPLGNSACGNACYQTSQYCCQSGQLRQVGQCNGTPGSTGSTGICAGSHLGPSQYCCSTVNGGSYGPQAACPIGQHCCGNILNGTSYFGPQSVYVGCYDSSVSKCCYGGTSAYFNPSYIQPNSYQIPDSYIGQRCVN